MDKKELILVQQLSKAIDGYWDFGKKSRFEWSVERNFSDGKSRVGSWGANWFFEVKTGKTDRETLINARERLRRSFKASDIHNLGGVTCKFSIVEQED